MRVRNTFEIFGDDSPFDADSIEEAAQTLLCFYDSTQDGRYLIRPPEFDATGYASEIEWQRDLYDAAEQISESDEIHVISREDLVARLTDALEIVED